MATRSSIALKTADGIRAIYCHWDGYPDEEGGVGKTLEQHYKKLSDVENLLKGGDLSSLSINPETSVTYKALQGTDNPAIIYENRDSWLKWAWSCDCEYAYLFINDSWTVVGVH
jgi:hypothetical protein